MLIIEQKIFLISKTNSSARFIFNKVETETGGKGSAVIGRI